MNRTLIYSLGSHAPVKGKRTVPQHVIRQLELLRPHYSQVVIVSSDNDAAAFLDFDGKFIKVPNHVGQWAKWRAGIQLAGWPALSSGSLTLMTDAAIGPTNSISDFLTRLDDEEPDFWIYNNVGAPFFFYFSPEVTRSASFHAFWNAEPPANGTASTLRQHLFAALHTAGFHDDVAVKTDPNAVPVKIDDPTLPRPDLWMELDSPFLLIDELLQRPDFTPYALNYLYDGGYPAETASAYLSQLSAPDEPSLLWAKQRDYLAAHKYGPKVTDMDDADQIALPKVAIHVHAHYPEMLGDFFTIFTNYSFPFDLFITTPVAKVTAVKEQLAAYELTAQVAAVPNLGRDIYPLVLLKDKLQNYEVIGHFHTKKSNHERGFVADSWLREIIDMVVVPADPIIADFARRPELGVVIADVPSFFRLNRIVYPAGEAPLIPILNDLWTRMDLSRELDFGDRDTFVMSYGTFFWARFDAIKPLLDLDLVAELPPEPVPDNHTILHALERIFVYLAWAQGYDFAISEGRYLTVFADEPAPHLEAVPFKSLVRRKITNRLPVPVKRRILDATGWKAKD